MQISPHAFTGLGPKIRSLYLDSNKMSNLSDMSNFTGLEILNLQDVPFHCNCQLLPLCRWVPQGGNKPQEYAWGAAGSPMLKAQAHSTLAVFSLFPWWWDVPQICLQGWKLPRLPGCSESSQKLVQANSHIFRGHPGDLALLWSDHPLMGIDFCSSFCPASFLSLICHISRWINQLNLRIGATCGSPAEAQGLKVKLSTTFQTCPGWGQGEAGETNPNKTKAASKPSKKKRLGKSPARGFSKSRA